MASLTTSTYFALLSLGDLVIEMTIPVVLVLVAGRFGLKLMAWIFARRIAQMPPDMQERTLEAFHAFQVNPNGKDRRWRKKKDL